MEFQGQLFPAFFRDSIFVLQRQKIQVKVEADDCLLSGFEAVVGIDWCWVIELEADEEDDCLSGFSVV